MAGIADDFVTWKTWFETGFMEHWRSLKSYLGASLEDFLFKNGKVHPLGRYYFESTVLCIAYFRGVFQVDRAQNLRGKLFLGTVPPLLAFSLALTLLSYARVQFNEDVPNTLIYIFVVYPLANWPNAIVIFVLLHLASISLLTFYSHFIDPRHNEDLYRVRPSDSLWNVFPKPCTLATVAL